MTPCDKAGAYALTKFPGSREQQRDLVESVRALIQKKLEAGETKNFGPSKAKKKQQRDKGHKR